MISLYAVDTRPLSARFDTLVDQLPPERRRRVLSCVNREGALGCLAGGLLLRAVFGDAANSIRTDGFGKPRLADARPFNLSHSGDYALLGVADADIGVDIEQIRLRPFSSVAKRFFSENDQALLKNAADPEDTFFTLWTLKESYLKAIGRGFYEPMRSADIRPIGESGAELPGHGEYRFRRYRDIGGYAVAVCSLDDRFPERIEQMQF